jgi:hypothetical protein
VEDARVQLQALARGDGERALGLAGRALVHKLRNCIQPMSLQLAILQKRVPEPSDGQREVLDGLRQSISRAHRILDCASRLADEISPPSRDDADQRRLYDELEQPDQT